ncbi:MAG: hypothetical protein D5R97_10150 [Candidatus Syntrophonatronum acetioxidans]|uniref:P-II family nitrogen regulator n=1 Tax=Candidatus Syntrophonatronum acetioxidans TaxID=1795816 RepID=A0A424Y9B7_9FIRM|nr:MAG: hypothetical protein D5R97_10150 [Candidatus Syntrophonatronum acetioxidans]
MKLLVLVLNETENLNDILEGFLDVGIRGATVIDSTGMGRILSPHVPLFGGLSYLFEGERTSNVVAFSLIEDDNKVKEALEVIKKVQGDMCKPGSGIVFTLEVDQVIGLAGKLCDENNSA